MRSRTILYIAAGIAAILALCLTYAYFIEPDRLVINRQELRIGGWEQEFNGFKAVLISDIHGGSRGGESEKIRQIVEAANAENPDAIFLLGDYVSQERGRGEQPRDSALRMPVSEIADLLSAL